MAVVGCWLLGNTHRSPNSLHLLLLQSVLYYWKNYYYCNCYPSIMGRQIMYLLAAFALVAFRFCSRLFTWKSIPFFDRDKESAPKVKREQQGRQSADTPDPCKVYEEKLLHFLGNNSSNKNKNNTDSFFQREEINSLRRRLAMNQGTYHCYVRLKPYFAKLFLEHLPRRSHMVLHIPKAAGTSMCSISEKEGNYPQSVNRKPGYFLEEKEKRDNCWQAEFCPFWCCYRPPNPPRNPISCPQLEKRYDAFVMNENYLDYPWCTQDRTYSMLIRDPVARTVSHMRHLNKFVKKGITPKESFGWRSRLAQYDYMTWALSAGRLSYPLVREIRNGTESGQDSTSSNETLSRGRKIITINGPQYYSKYLDDADFMFAKKALAKMDFIFDLTNANTQYEKKCTEQMLQLMGMDTVDLVKENVGNGARAQSKEQMNNVNTTILYNSTNRLDVQLYQYGRKIMKVDCDFFRELSLSNLTATMDQGR